MKMASVAEKLYPPTIGGSIPACYKNEAGTVIITVPFSMNRAVDSSLVGGMKLKIKTVQSNTYLATLDVDNLQDALNKRIASFSWTENGFNASHVKLGQYLKVQLAYVGKDANQTVGYFSTVAVVKYTSKPKVYIQGLGENANQIEAFRQTYLGVFETGEDKSERPYAYNFYLYDKQGYIVETSGWTLHNTSINNIASESLSLDQATDSYTFQTLIKESDEYYLQYGVRTINNLEVFSPIYTCIQPQIGNPTLFMDLVATNNFEEAYIELKLKISDKWLKNQYNGDYVITTLNPNGKFEYSIYRLKPEPSEDEKIAQLSEADLILDEPVSIEIRRAEKTDNFDSWSTLQKIYFSDYSTALHWSFKDLTIEQGVTYKYSFRQYNKQMIQSNLQKSNEVQADFEDMFLWDGKRQLKIRFNPKVSSFKTNHLEQKMDTIGSKFPFFFRNGVVEYREFPIAGLISYKADNNEMFLNYQEDLHLIRGDAAERKSNPVYNKDTKEFSDTSYETSETLDSVGYNMYAERIFKMRLLEWLGNGEIKMFKSAAEGNYLVRIMNISLTPEDKLGRMIHNFSCTAYEVEELTYQNLLDLKFIVPVDEEEVTREMESIHLGPDPENPSNLGKISLITNTNESIPLNNYPIVDYLYLSMTPTLAGGNGFFVRVGEDIPSKAAFLREGFIIKSDNSALPSLWFNIQDNADLLQERNLEVSKEGAETLVGNAVLTYYYDRTTAMIGELYNIENVYIQNKIETISGPANFPPEDNDDSSVEKEILKFFVLNFKKKPIKEIEYDSNSGNYVEPGTEDIIYHFDLLSLYKITGEDVYYYTMIEKDPQTGEERIILCDEPMSGLPNDAENSKIVLVYNNDEQKIFTEPPVLNLNDTSYKNIQLGASIYLECAYQIKITNYKVG